MYKKHNRVLGDLHIGELKDEKVQGGNEACDLMYCIYANEVES